jgi:hypothetical protein
MFEKQSATVDGEGVLLLPGGTSVACLRVKTTRRAMVDLPYEMIIDTMTEYTFVDANGIGIASFAAGYSGVMTSYQNSAHVVVQQPVAPGSDVRPSTPGTAPIFTLASNPVIDKLTLQYALEQTEGISIRVTNAVGREVYQMHSLAADMNGQLTIDCTNWPVGGYVVSLRTTQGIASAKVVKLN